MSLGNHEFDNGVNGLTPFIKNLSCPVLAANLILTKVPTLANEANLMKSIVLDVNGRKIGIIGYLTPDTKVLAVPNDVEYTDEIKAIKFEVEKLQSRGVDIIIALGHSGYLKDLEIAKEVDGVDLVIGGHTNTFLWNGTSPDSEKSAGPYPTYVTQNSGRRVPVVQAYAYTKYLGKLNIIFDSDGEIIHAQGIPILLDQHIPQDPYVLSLLDKYKTTILKTTEDVLGRTSVILDAGCIFSECNLGNLITDALVHRYASTYKGEHWTDAPIAMIQTGGIRTSVVHAVMPTNLTKGDLLAVMPFEGNAVTVTANGSIILQALEHSVAPYNADAIGQFLQFSGLQVTFDLTKAEGSRVVKAEARCWACDIPRFSKVMEKDIYKIIMPGFLATGGDGYSMFKELPRQNLDFSELMATEYYVASQSLIYPQVEGRITIINSNDRSSSFSHKLAVFPILLALFAKLFVVS